MITSITILNAGTQTRRAFRDGAGDVPVHTYKTKRMLLHLGEDGGTDFIYKNEPINFKDTVVFTRLRASDAHFCGMLYDYFAYHRIPTNDPINLSYPYSAEKISQMLLLTLAGIPIPESFIFREESFLANRAYLETHLTFPAIYKLDGSRGRNVHYITSFAELETHMTKKPKAFLALVQPFIENTFDTRTLVAYDEVLGSIKRTRTKGFLNNIAQGAVASPMELTDPEKDVVRRATRACRIDFAGVDMVHTPNGPIVLEVNKSPQIAGFESVHPFKVFTRVAQILTRKEQTQ